MTGTPEERLVLGSLLIKSTIHNQIEGLITGDDFTDERLGIVFDNVIVMAARGDHVDAAIVNMRLADWGVKGLDTEPFAWTDGVYEYSVRDYAMAVHAASIRRRTELEISTARSRLQDGEDPTAVTSDLATRTKEIATGNVQDGLRANALENILQLEAKHDWVFPDLLERQDRLVVTGGEGSGKTTLVRQMAVAGAAGIHPLELYRITPVDVLVIDAENTEMQWKRQTERMVDVARSIGVRDPAKHIHVVAGKRLDISKGAHLSQIHKLIDEYDPKLVLIGPLYKLVPNAINNDTDAAPLIVALDSLRERGVALVMEAHAGKAENTAGQRNMAPRGSAALLGWPETGIGLRQYPDNPDVSEVVRWRGDREERSWPQELFRSYRGFPWSKEDPAGVPLGG